MLTLICSIMLSFISTKSSTVFHTDSCRYATQIIDKLDANTINNVRIYADVNEAIAAGKRPCLVCDPMNWVATYMPEPNLVPSKDPCSVIVGWLDPNGFHPATPVTGSYWVEVYPYGTASVPAALQTISPTCKAVCQHWLAGADCNIPSGNGDWNGDKVVDLRDFALAANGDTDKLVIWGVTECDMWESNAIVNRERVCK